MGNGNASVQVSIPEMIKGRQAVEDRHGEFVGLKNHFDTTTLNLTAITNWHSAASVEYARAAGTFYEQMEQTERDLDDIKNRLQATIDRYHANESETHEASKSII